MAVVANREQRKGRDGALFCYLLTRQGAVLATLLWRYSGRGQAVEEAGQ